MIEIWQNRSFDNIVKYITGVGLLTENWAPLPGYELCYHISCFGRVKSLDRKVWQPQFSRFVLRKGRILKQKIDRGGYAVCCIHVDCNRIDTGVHKLVAKTFVSNPENKPQVNHKSGNKLDNTLWNLEWNTAKENSNHAIAIGIDSVVGEHNGRSILTEKQVIEIRSGYIPKIYNNYRKRMAEKYGISKSVIHKIVMGYSWKHINNKDGSNKL